MSRPRVWFIPEERGRLVTMHACWGADFAGETAVFPTEAEAVEFCHKRWRRAPVIDRRGLTGKPGPITSPEAQP